MLGCSKDKDTKAGITKKDILQSNEYRYFLQEMTCENCFISNESLFANYYFSDDSNLESVNSFKYLTINIRHDWTENKIYFKGYLTGNIKTAKELFPEQYKDKDVSGYGTPPDNKYHEFKIENWYIEVPFKEMNCGGEEVTFIDREKLTKGDFKRNRYIVKGLCYLFMLEIIDLNKHMKSKKVKE